MTKRTQDICTLLIWSSMASGGVQTIIILENMRNMLKSMKFARVELEKV